MNFNRLKNLFRLTGRNKLALATNITGVAIGLASTILLVIYILHETSYDRYFSRSENIFRLNTIWIENGNSSYMPINLRSAFTEVPAKIPEIESAVQIYRGWDMEVCSNEVRFAGNRLLFVDSTFFNLFDFKVLEGSANQALKAPNSVVLTKKMAQKIFGDKHALGQSILAENKSYTIAAIIEDVPVNTHFQFDFLMPMSAIGNLNQLQGLEFFTYYLIKPAAEPGSTILKICETNTQILKDRFASFNYDFSSSVEPLNKIHLYSPASYDLGRQGSIKTIFLVGVIAFMVMFLALTNFINLFIVEGEQRAKEIGVRKVSGAGKAALIKQFFSEASFIVLISFLIGLILAVVMLPQFGNLMQREFSISLLKAPVFIFSLAGVFLLTLLLSGAYPAFYLSRLKPVSIISKQPGKTSRKKYVMNLAGGLQLIITLFLLTVLFGIQKQTHYLKNLSPGFNPDGLVNIFNLNDKMKGQYSSIRDELMDLPEIIGVAASSHTIGAGTSGQGIRLVEEPEDNLKSVNEYRIQPGLCNLLELQLADGRFFDPERPADRNGIILNEAAVKELGLTSAVGRQVVMFNDPMEIIGVVKDFRYQSAAREIQPLVMTSYSRNFNNIVVRLAPNALYDNVIGKIEKVLKSFDNGYIINTRVTRDIYTQYYADEERLGQLTRLGAVLAIVIVMMGIFMLVSQSIVRRTKEIGVRKVLGGTIGNMIILIYSNSLKWTAIAALIAVPLSYLYLRQWLGEYAVKTPIGWWLFIEGLVIVLLLETIITFAHTWRAATRNPVEALRYE